MTKRRTRITQQQAASLLGVEQQTISKWVRIGLDLDQPDEALRLWVAERWSRPDAQNNVVPQAPSVTTVVPPLTVAQRTAGLNYAETRTEKLRREIEHLELKIQRERGDLVAAQSVREQGMRIASVWCSELDAMVSDLPGQVAGLSEAELQPKLKARIETLKTKIRHQMEAL